MLKLEQYCDIGNFTEHDADVHDMYSMEANNDNASMDSKEDVRPPEPENMPNTALMSTILMLGTFLIAFFLRKFRNSKFLGRSVRRALGDFGVPIAIVAMTGVDELVVSKTYTEV